MYRIEELKNLPSLQYSDFLDFLYESHWPLTSSGFQREPTSRNQKRPKRSLQTAEGQKVFVLLRCGRIVSSVKVSYKETDCTVCVLSHVETLPEHQKKGIFGLTLGNECLRAICSSDECKRIELITWSFNRKGIPLYKMVGFRAVPGTSLLMENYLPAILKHPDTQPYFAKHDYIRTLKNKRSYGYDAIDGGGMSVFEYRWKPRKAKDSLRVWVDWQKKEIVDVVCLLDEAKNSSEDPDHA